MNKPALLENPITSLSQRQVQCVQRLIDRVRLTAAETKGAFDLDFTEDRLADQAGVFNDDLPPGRSLVPHTDIALGIFRSGFHGGWRLGGHRRSFIGRLPLLSVRESVLASSVSKLPVISPRLLMVL